MKNSNNNIQQNHLEASILRTKIIDDIRAGYIKIKQTDPEKFKEMQSYYKAQRYDMFVFDVAMAFEFYDIFNN